MSTIKKAQTICTRAMQALQGGGGGGGGRYDHVSLMVVPESGKG